MSLAGQLKNEGIETEIDFLPYLLNIRSNQDIIFEKGRSLVKDLTSAQVLDIVDTPVELVAAPGANRAIVFEGALGFYDYNATAYTIGTAGDVEISYTDGSGTICSSIDPTGVFDAEADQFVWFYPPALGLELTVNAPLVLNGTTADMTAGDSPFNMRVFYSIIDVTNS